MFNIVLVNPEIPQNTGNIGRTVLSQNCVLHLVKPLGFEIDDKNLKRAGLDYWKHVDVRIWDKLEDIPGLIGSSRLHFFSTKGKNRYDKAEYKKGDFLIFGSETKGLPQKILDENSEQTRVIPMPDRKVRSLNLASSVSSILMEALRQNDFFESGV
jgi:tRNA (cytidine/uridine-2'-O-)-methyltransferase